jgi:hypothetical protein
LAVISHCTAVCRENERKRQRMEGIELRRERKLNQYFLLIISFFAAIFAFLRSYHIYVNKKH